MNNDKDYGFLYVIGYGNSNRYKIGVTSRKPSDRLKELQTGAADELQLIKSYQFKNPRTMEAKLHEYFKHSRKSGEWFEVENSSIITDVIEQYSSHSDQPLNISVSRACYGRSSAEIYARLRRDTELSEDSDRNGLKEMFFNSKSYARDELRETQELINDADDSTKINILLEMVTQLAMENTLRHQEINVLTDTILDIKRDHKKHVDIDHDWEPERDYNMNFWKHPFLWVHKKLCRWHENAKKKSFHAENIEFRIYVEAY